MPGKPYAHDHLESHPTRSVNNANSSDSSVMTESVSPFLQATASALADSQLDDTIAQPIPTLNELVRYRIEIHELRARAWAKKANTTEGLKSALAMIQIAPNYSSGYLRAGKLYSMQGYQDIAMKMFNKGLANIPPSDPHYVNIQQEFELVKVRFHEHVDFIARCPYDIASKIISHLTDDAFVESVMVSRVWRKMLLEEPLRWKTFTVRHGARTNCLLPSLCRHIEELSLKGKSPLVLKSLNLLNAGHELSKLRSLKVERIGLADRHSRDSLVICNVLLAISKTLTRLHINDSSIKLPPIAAILLICRNLSDLKLVQPEWSVYWLTGFPSSLTTSLTRLSLTASPKDHHVSAKSIGTLLRSSPALEQLAFYYYSADILALIAHNCRNVTSVLFNTDPLRHLDYLRENTDFAPGALRSLSLAGRFTMLQIQPLLDIYHNTLAALYLLPDSGIPDEIWDQLSTYSFPSLKLCHVKLFADGINETVPHLIRHSPSLKDITLDFLDSEIGDATLDAISELKRLDYLKICRSYLRGLRLQLLNHCKLRQLNIDKCVELNDNVLTGIAAIDSLESLIFVVDDDDERGWPDNIEGFFERLGRMPCLKDTLFECMDLSDIAIQNLCASESLKNVTFLTCDVSDEALCLLDKHGVKVIIA